LRSISVPAYGAASVVGKVYLQSVCLRDRHSQDICF
jgi:hypothetical protein